jgi:alkylmercury lyase
MLLERFILIKEPLHRKDEKRNGLPMKPSALDMLATQLVAHLDCTQDVVCQQILRGLAETGQPLAPTQLARCFHMSHEHVMAHLAHVADTEFDEEGQIVGWGITLVPTQHQFWVQGHALFTWCAFDTVLFPSLLGLCAQVQSLCATSGQPIRFRAKPEGIEELAPTTAVLSLILPAARCDCVRETFCQQSLFFHSEQAASTFLNAHPEAVLLSLEEATMVAQTAALLLPHF